ncbi:cell division protein ZapA [Psychrobacillus vulpis]|uniref:Cell division protein ZapA n=1 Tax=Psychrobacillus vulpis TaxID=2325572 RepID=A0A544TQY6_9BACI|nr:cell division protein ZapA [Psychrobacillus vulpis]TQR19862.1 cell division protein ZapA [Psychrobacillus vulpis]
MSEQQKTKISVDIYGQNYIMVGSETSGHMRLVASMVDDKMREIHSHNGHLDIAKLAVLTAVNAVNDYIKVKEQLELLEEELKRLKD